MITTLCIHFTPVIEKWKKWKKQTCISERSRQGQDPDSHQLGHQQNCDIKNTEAFSVVHLPKIQMKLKCCHLISKSNKQGHTGTMFIWKRLRFRWLNVKVSKVPTSPLKISKVLSEKLRSKIGFKQPFFFLWLHVWIHHKIDWYVWKTQGGDLQKGANPSHPTHWVYCWYVHSAP